MSDAEVPSSITPVLQGDAVDEFLLLYTAGGIPFTVLLIFSVVLLLQLPQFSVRFLPHCAVQRTLSLSRCFCANLAAYILLGVTLAALFAWYD